MSDKIRLLGPVTDEMRDLYNARIDDIDNLKQQLAEAQKPDVCSVCAGNGEPVSRLPCICGGTGTIYGEMQGLRKELVEARGMLKHYTKAEPAAWKDLREKNAKLKEALKKLTGHNLPVCFEGDNDDAGHCPYCYGWNMEHDDGCPVVAAEELLK